jgi:ribosomal protein S12 methylthiotransferase accessory factor
MEEALAKAILETIERDAVMIRWYARLPPPALDIDPRSVLPQSPAPGDKLNVRLYDLTVDGDVSVIGAICIERTGRPCFFILSAAAALDAFAAARKALLEVGQGRPFIKNMIRKEAPPERETLFADFESNLRFYAEPSNARYVEWFGSNSALSHRTLRTNATERRPRQNLSDVLKCCSKMGLGPIAFDITTPEMIDTGLFGCKVVVPELVPLCLPSMPPLAHPRLARFIESSSPRAGVPSPLDAIPHPFP